MSLIESINHEVTRLKQEYTDKIKRELEFGQEKKRILSSIEKQILEWSGVSTDPEIVIEIYQDPNVQNGGTRVSAVFRYKDVSVAVSTLETLCAIRDKWVWFSLEERDSPRYRINFKEVSTSKQFKEALIAEFARLIHEQNIKKCP